MPITDTNQHDTGQDTGRWGRIPAWWLNHPDIDADGLAVLAALSTYANSKGECWPAQATLATALKRSRSTVNRILGHLAEARIIEVAPRKSANGGRLSSIYRLRMEPGTGPIAKDAATAVRPRDTDVATPDSPCAPARQEQPDSKHKPDSLAEGGGEGGGEQRAAKPVPADWMPSAADLTWASAQYSAIDLARHVEGFVLRCTAHGYRYRNIGAAWRAWLVQDAAARKAPPRASGKTDSKAAAAQQQVAIWAGVAENQRRQPKSTTPSFRGGF